MLESVPDASVGAWNSAFPLLPIPSLKQAKKQKPRKPIAQSLCIKAFLSPTPPSRRPKPHLEGTKQGHLASRKQEAFAGKKQQEEQPSKSREISAQLISWQPCSFEGRVNMRDLFHFNITELYETSLSSWLMRPNSLACQKPQSWLMPFLGH